MEWCLLFDEVAGVWAFTDIDQLPESAQPSHIAMVPPHLLACVSEDASREETHIRVNKLVKNNPAAENEFLKLIPGNAGPLSHWYTIAHTSYSGPTFRRQDPPSMYLPITDEGGEPITDYALGSGAFGDTRYCFADLFYGPTAPDLVRHVKDALASGGDLPDLFIIPLTQLAARGILFFREEGQSNDLKKGAPLYLSCGQPVRRAWSDYTTGACYAEPGLYIGRLRLDMSEYPRLSGGDTVCVHGSLADKLYDTVWRRYVSRRPRRDTPNSDLKRDNEHPLIFCITRTISSLTYTEDDKWKRNHTVVHDYGSICYSLCAGTHHPQIYTAPHIEERTVRELIDLNNILEFLAGEGLRYVRHMDKFHEFPKTSAEFHNYSNVRSDAVNLYLWMYAGLEYLFEKFPKEFRKGDKKRLEHPRIKEELERAKSLGKEVRKKAAKYMVGLIKDLEAVRAFYGASVTGTLAVTSEHRRVFKEIIQKHASLRDNPLLKGYLE